MMVLEKGLEEYGSVVRWLRDLSYQQSGSESTKRHFLWVLKSFCDSVGKSPDEMVSECRGSEEARREYADKIKAFVMRNDRTKDTIATYSTAMKSFFRHNGVEVPVGRVKSWVTYEDRAITPEELRKLLKVADLRTKVAVAVLAQSGMRTETLAKLTYSHVREGLEKEEAPLRIYVASELAKDRAKSFDTFIGPEAIELLKSHIEARKRGTKYIEGEAVVDESPLIRNDLSRDILGV